MPKSSDTALPPGLPTRPNYLNFTEENGKQALIEARGDIFVASQILGITALRLNRAIGVSALLKATVDAMPALAKGMSPEALNALIEERLLIYRVDGLDALHDLATMPLDDNSAQNQVKLAAAARLAGTAESVGVGGLEDVLRELNKSYQENAPRLRVIRERTTIETIQEKEVDSGGTSG